MADLSGQIDQARKAGYSDADIVGFLKQKEPKVAKALDSGYQPQEVLAYLTRSAVASVSKPPTGYRAVKPGEIPTESGFVAEPQQDVPRSFMQRVLGYGEVPIALASGAVGGVVEPVARLAGEVFGPGKLGSAEATRSGEAAAQAVTRGLYRPQSPEAQGTLQTIGKALEPVMAFGPAGPIAALGAPSGTLKPAVQAAKDITAPKVQALVQPEAQAAANRAANQLRAKVEASQTAGPVIDAAKDAVDLGLAVNPALTNPTKANRLRSTLAGDKAFDFLATQQNAAKTTQLIREDLGVAPGAALDKAAVDAALAKASAPYEPVRQLGQLQVSDKVQSALQSLKNERPLGNAQSVAASNRLIDEVIQQLQEGRSGAEVLNAVRQQRVDANSLLSSATKTPETTQLAKTHKGIASALELLIDENAPNPQVLKDMQAARQRLAQIYEHESAIDFATGTIDPQAYVQIFNDRQGRMTGVGAKIARVAGTFPSIMQKMEPTMAPPVNAKRSGIAAAGGALIGGQLAGYPGAIGGAAALGAADALRARAFARNMLTPEYQAANVMAPDWRSAAMFLPETPVIGKNVLPSGAPSQWAPNQLAPYDWRNAALPAGEPNWVFGRSDLPPNVSVSRPPVGAPQLPAPSAESTMATLRAEDARRAAMSRALGQETEAQQAAAEAAKRRPAAGEVILDFDPVTGRFREASQGLKGATPETFRNFGSDLASAADKVTAGKRFDLTAAEKVAWERTKVDLAEVVPGLKKLTDAAIAEKMMDRQWVQSAIDKARQQAAAFEEIAARAKDAQAQRQALANRERMLDMLETLEEQFRAPRPVELGGQGPKTRAAQRNAMAPKSKNNLAP